MTEREHAERVARERWERELKAMFRDSSKRFGDVVKFIARVEADAAAKARAEALAEAEAHCRQYMEDDAPCDCRGNWNRAVTVCVRAIRALAKVKP